jgi:hypothetical protein
MVSTLQNAVPDTTGHTATVDNFLRRLHFANEDVRMLDTARDNRLPPPHQVVHKSTHGKWWALYDHDINGGQVEG